VKANAENCALPEVLSLFYKRRQAMSMMGGCFAGSMSFSGGKAWAISPELIGNGLNCLKDTKICKKAVDNFLIWNYNDDR